MCNNYFRHYKCETAETVPSMSQKSLLENNLPLDKNKVFFI
jgi:hypothetical protein